LVHTKKLTKKLARELDKKQYELLYQNGEGNRNKIKVGAYPSILMDNDFLPSRKEESMITKSFAKTS
jgi:hypothetical protein